MTENEMYLDYVKNYFYGDFLFRVDHSRLPDVYTSSSNGVLWLELKIVKQVRRDGYLWPNWRPGQLVWIEDQENKTGIDNVSLVLYYLPKKECRLYQKCKLWYSMEDEYTVIGVN